MLLNNFSEFKYEAGVDEAGRGSLAGPVTAAAVIFDKDFNHDELNDSKKISLKKRVELKKVIQENSLAYSVAFVSPKEIDKKNILNSTFTAMHKAIENLSIKPNFILVDGNKFKPVKNIPHKCIVMGDQKYQNIAAASILAKTYRDEYMKKIDIDFPNYDWGRNKGYGTKYHIKMIIKYGKTIHHRLSFKIKPKQLNLQFNQ